MAVLEDVITLHCSDCLGKKVFCNYKETAEGMEAGCQQPSIVVKCYISQLRSNFIRNITDYNIYCSLRLTIFD
jgi:hypothetical protein